MTESKKKSTLHPEPEPTIGQRIDARLKEIDQGIRALEERGKEVQEGAVETIRENLASLRKRREVLMSRLREVRGSSSGALEDLKEGTEDAWGELQQSARDLSKGVSKALHRFRGEDKTG